MGCRSTSGVEPLNLPFLGSVSSRVQWKQDLLEDRGRIWTDYVSDNGRWRCEQGYSTKASETWALIRVESGKRRWVSDHKTLWETKEAAEALESQNNS